MLREGRYEKGNAMRVSFELSARDVKYFRERLRQVRTSKNAQDEAIVIEGAQSLVKEAVAAEPPEFVTERLAKLEQLIEMLLDGDWRLLAYMK